MNIKQIQYEVGGQKVIGDIFNAGQKQGVLLIHGSSDRSREYAARKNQEDRARAIANAGFTVLTFDMRGYGESEGDLEEISIADHLRDTKAAYDYLESLVEKVHVCGGSYGGYLAVLLTRDKRVETLLLRVPAIYEDELLNVKGTYKVESMDFRRMGDFKDTFAIKAISEYSRPLYIIGSELDEFVPRRVLDAYFKNSASKIKKIDWLIGAKHSPRDLETQQKSLNLITDWYKGVK